MHRGEDAFEDRMGHLGVRRELRRAMREVLGGTLLLDDPGGAAEGDEHMFESAVDAAWDVVGSTVQARADWEEAPSANGEDPFGDALDELVLAADRLVDRFYQANNTEDEQLDYPEYLPSFDEFASDLRDWRDARDWERKEAHGPG